jgi:hypothetical protein
MVRFFGKPTTGAYVDASVYSYYGTLVGPYFCDIYDGSLYSEYNNEGIMIHKAFPVDEEVWLTRDGAAKGEDDVVKRAIEWITTLSYAHDVQASKDTLRRAGDSLTVTAEVENPGGHTLIVSAIITNAQGQQVDSLVLMNDGLHGDGAAGDSISGNFIKSPTADGKYNISVRTEDKNAGSFRRLPDAAWFTVSLTAVKEFATDLPQTFGLDQNYPNPFNPTTIISFQVPVVSEVKLIVYDPLGREVAVLVNEHKGPGRYQVQFDASGLASGVYFYRLISASFVQARKMVVVR